MRIPVSLRLSFVAFAIVIIGVIGCRKPDPAVAAPAEIPFISNSTIKDLMLNVVDRQADVVWLSVTTVASDKGLVETRPKNDEEWAAVKAGAITLAEAAWREDHLVRLQQ